SSANDTTFDYLFRKHLMNVYAILGEKVPDDLHLPIKKKKDRTSILEPTDFIHPVLDGRVTSYFEWQNAGRYRTEAGTTGTMQKAENLVQTIYYGFDADTLYFRIDTNRPITTDFLKGITLKLILQEPQALEIPIELTPDSKVTHNGEIIGATNKII